MGLYYYIIIQYHSRIGVPTRPNSGCIMGDYSAAIPYFGPIVISPQSQRQTLQHSKLIGVKPRISSHQCLVQQLGCSVVMGKLSSPSNLWRDTRTNGNASDSLGTPRSLAAQVAVGLEPVGRLQKPVTQTFLGYSWFYHFCLQQIVEEESSQAGPRKLCSFIPGCVMLDAAVPGCFPAFKNSKTSRVFKITMKIWSC